jgi:hypothetical protein
MTWTTRILAILNVLAALVLLYAAAQSATARNAWAERLKNLRELRDGLATETWLAKLPDAQLDAAAERIQLTPELIARVPPAVQDKLRVLEARKQAAGLRRHRLMSEAQQRAALGHLTFDPKDPKADPGLLRLDKGEIRELAKDLGPAGFTRLIREAILIHKPRLQAEARELAETKASLLRLRNSIQADIEKLRADIELLTDRRRAEEFLRERLAYENVERRRELSRLYAELEEAQHAADVAAGREADALNQLEETRNRISNLEELNRSLEQRLLQMESATARSSPR